MIYGTFIATILLQLFAYLFDFYFLIASLLREENVLFCFVLSFCILLIPDMFALGLICGNT